MKQMPILVGTAVSLFATGFAASSQDAPRRGTDGKDVRSAPSEKANAAQPPSPRKPGFLFLELGTERIDEYIAFFQDVAGYRLSERKGRFATMHTDLAELLLMDPRDWPKGHPFYDKVKGSGQGLGVEIGLVVGDLDKVYASALKHKGWKISTGIALRPWGVRDFRVLSPDGYYLRFTEPPR